MGLAGALVVAQLWLGAITQPRPKKFTFEDLLDSINKGDETRPVPYIRGKWKTKPQRIWLGDFKVRAVERDSHWTDHIWADPLSFLLDTITVSHRYYVGQAFDLCWGPINRVHQVYVDDLPCAVSPVVDNAGGSLLLDDPNLFGGDQPHGGKGLGGVYAVCDVIAGNYTQGRNAYIQSLEGNIPALRGVAALVVRGPSGATESGYFSALQLNLREWQVELMAWPDVLGDGFNHLSDDSYNRVHSLYEWTTSADYGAEYPTSKIHLPSWREASAQVYDEGLGFRGEINTGENVRQVWDALRDSIDAEIYEHPSDGLKIKLIRKDYSIPALKVLDESNCDVVEEYTPGDLADTFNRTELRFIDASNNYQPKPAIYEDPANRTLRRFGSVKTIEYPGVGSAALAQLLVTREGRAAAQPLPPLVVNSGEVARDLWPGDTFQFEWSDPLVRKIFRVHARTPSVAFEAPRNFRIQSTEDQYSIGMSVFGAPEGTDASDPVDCWNTAPPDATFDTTLYPPDGLQFSLKPGLGGQLLSVITGGIVFGTYACGQYARVYVTEPGGVETLSPLVISPDVNDKGRFDWPALTSGTYQFCIQTFSLTGVTTGNKVCASIGAASFSVSPSGSVSPSASQSPSPSPSTSPSSSASPSISPSPSPSFSPSVSPSGSASPSASQSPSGSVSPSHSQSPSSSASPSSGNPEDPPGVAPDDLSGLELWLKANNDQFDSTSDGTQISVDWQDSSTNNRDATPVASGPGTVFPIFKLNQLNGYPAIRMVQSGTTNGGWFTLPDFLTGFTAGEVFCVVILDNDPVSHNASHAAANWGPATDDSYYPFSGDGKIYDKWGTTARKDAISYTGALTSWHLYNVRSASGAWSNHKNGTQLHSTGTNTVGWGTSPMIARNVQNSKTLQGLVAEVIFYSRVLTSSERFDTIHTYLNNKYNLGLPTS